MPFLVKEANEELPDFLVEQEMPCLEQILRFFEHSSFQGVPSESANSGIRQSSTQAGMRNDALRRRRGQIPSADKSGLNLRSFRFFLVSFAVGVYSSCLTKASVRLFLEPTEAKRSP
jgi:hypothetical protein